MVDGRQIQIRSIPTTRHELASITSDELASNSITTAKIADSSVTPAKLDREYAEDPVVKVLDTVSSVDLKAIGTTSFSPVPAGKKWLVTRVEVECSAAVAITAEAIAGIGVAAGEDDIFASQSLVSLKAAGDLFIFEGIEGVVANAADVIKAGIDTGSVGTSQEATFRIIGIEVNA